MITKIEQLLSTQNPDGSWGDPLKFYTDKYKGTVWTVLMLAELHADRKDPRVQQACEFLLHHSYDARTGGFSTTYSPKYDGGLPSKVIPCLTGNMVFAMIRLGYLDDPRIQQSIQWIVTYQRVDDGTYKEPLLDQYKNHKACFSKHSCFMGVVKSLKALTEIPVARRSEEVNSKIQQLSEFMLLHHIYRKSSDLSVIAKPTWLRFRFPLMYQTDIMEIVDLFRQLEISDERLHDAIELIKSKQNKGTWHAESDYYGKLLIPIGRRGTSSQWLTEKGKRILEFYDN